MYRIRDEALRWVAKRRGIVVPSLLADSRQEDGEMVEEETVALGDVLEGVKAQTGANGSTTNGARKPKAKPRAKAKAKR
jgi:hypothetical protein